MNNTLILSFAAINLAGLFLFWLMHRKSNSTQSLVQNHLIEQLKDTNLSDEKRSGFEKQLSKTLLQKQSQPSFKITALVALFVLPFSLYFYHKLGNPQAVDYIAPTQQQLQDPQMSMEDALTQLEIRLSKNPDDVDGQMLYARSLFSVKEYAKAVAAYRKSNELAPNESVILTELAEAIALANNNRSFLGEPEGLLKRAVELEPNNQKALWLLGMTFYEHKNFAQANELWTKLYGIMSDEGAKKQLAQQLDDIRTKLTNSKSSTETKPQIDSTDKADLNIKISLDEKLKKQLKGKTALLYIYAKAPTGMPMPIAVVRQPLEQTIGFPINISMNDENSLQSNRKLSDFNEVKVGARISFTGNATPQAGDLQSDELLINLPNSDIINLNINASIH